MFKPTEELFRLLEPALALKGRKVSKLVLTLDVEDLPRVELTEVVDDATTTTARYPLTAIPQ